MSAKQFRCAKCGGTFTKGWSDEEAAAEDARTFPEVGPAVERAVVCDPCYQAFLRWLNKHPEERHRHGWE